MKSRAQTAKAKEITDDATSKAVAIRKADLAPHRSQERSAGDAPQLTASESQFIDAEKDVIRAS